LIKEGKRTIGSELVAQEFSLPQYFQPRPSAATYDPSSSGGSNLAPTSAKLVANYRDRIRALRDQNEAVQGKIPIELISMSASGLDPHISLGAALWQVPRIAGVRNLSRKEVEELVLRNVQAPLFGFIGEWRVNVLVLNRHLDQLRKPKEQ
jgi:K+-transporting ATPase ATPase C chain